MYMCVCWEKRGEGGGEKIVDCDRPRQELVGIPQRTEQTIQHCWNEGNYFNGTHVGAGLAPERVNKVVPSPNEKD